MSSGAKTSLPIRFTNNYETILGRGAFGEVFQGVLDDKSMVAIKRFISNVTENFAKELLVHREINHRNVVRLVGYCADVNSLILVMEYVPKGNLCNILHHDSSPIPLDTRLRIAIECAEALGYMHKQMYTQVIHGDIKPANILLDDEFRAKISDFGISRLINTENTLYTEHVVGSIGYMDPLFARNGRLTAKSDVYSFGVVLLELITRKKARTEDGVISLVDSFIKAGTKGLRGVREMFDAEIATANNMKTIEAIAKLAGKCMMMELDKRPEMLEVAESLRKIRRASDQGREWALFSRGRKTRPAPAEMTTQQKSSSNTPNMGTMINCSTMTRPFLELDDLLWASSEDPGTVGITFKATLETGDKVVVKSLRGDSPKEEFEQHVTMIGAIQNNAVLPMKWNYFSKDEKMLVYKYFPGKSLSHMLHGVRDYGIATLGWKQRIAISLAAARGVAFIHSAGPSSCHGNIKSSNVLLSSTNDAFVSEHSMITFLPGHTRYPVPMPELFRGATDDRAPLSEFYPGAATDGKPMYELCPGTAGKRYRAPEITNDKFVTQEDDVYGFGILLLELLTDKDPVKKTGFKDGLDLPHWLHSVARKKWAISGWHNKSGLRLLELAMKCCSQDADLRPTMSDIVQQIEDICRPHS